MARVTTTSLNTLYIPARDGTWGQAKSRAPTDLSRSTTGSVYLTSSNPSPVTNPRVPATQTHFAAISPPPPVKKWSPKIARDQLKVYRDDYGNTFLRVTITGGQPNTKIRVETTTARVIDERGGGITKYNPVVDQILELTFNEKGVASAEISLGDKRGPLYYEVRLPERGIPTILTGFPTGQNHRPCDGMGCNVLRGY